MKLRILVVAAIAAFAALVPGTAWAKGAQSVTITGPGLEAPVHLENVAGTSTVQVMRLADATGLLRAVFADSNGPMTQTRPQGRLGPRYRAAYELYTSQDATETVRQDVYPFSAAGFVTHTPRGQRFGNQSVQGGWYVIPSPRGAQAIPGTGTAMMIALGATDPRATRSSPARV